METNNYQIKLKQVREIAKILTPSLPYHNFNHALDVSSVANSLAQLSNVNYEDLFLLECAALLHDVVYLPMASDNEERSAELARKYLPSIRYSPKETEKIAKLILATKLPTNPSNLLESIICDADLDNLGRDNFFEKGEKYRQELRIPKEKWWGIQLQFLKNHQYHTKIARKLRDAGKLANIQKLAKLLQEEKNGGE